MELVPPPFVEFWVVTLYLNCHYYHCCYYVEREREKEMVGFSEFQNQVGLLTCELLVLETEGLVSPKVLHPWTPPLSL